MLAAVLETGQVIGGRLRVDRILGVGGFGVVAAATHLELGHSVAIKICRPEYTRDEEIVERLLREARAVAGLTTEHVCRVFDVGRLDDGTPYIVMELLQGSDVASLIKRDPLPPAIAVEYVIQACVALDEAHARGIVHRDLKPPNLWVTRRPDGTAHVKVLDFGIAKAADELRLTHSHVMLGSPQYMSPEQLTTPRDVDARTDIWSLAVTLYHMLARRLPFPSAQIAELAVMITHEPPRPIPEIDPALAEVLFRCMHKDRAQRYQTVGELAGALAPFGGADARRYVAMIRSAPALPAAAPAVATRETVASIHAPRPVDAAPTPASAMAPALSVASRAVPAPASRRSRTALWAVLGLVVVAGGGLVGYAAIGGTSSAKPPASSGGSQLPAPSGSSPSAAAASPHPSAGSQGTAASPPAPQALPKAFANDPERLAEFRADFAKLERTVALNPDEPRILFSAITMACILEEHAKAKAYFAKVTDAKTRTQAADACAAYGVKL